MTEEAANNLKVEKRVVEKMLSDGATTERNLRDYNLRKEVDRRICSGDSLNAAVEAVELEERYLNKDGRGLSGRQIRRVYED